MIYLKLKCHGKVLTILTLATKKDRRNPERACHSGKRLMIQRPVYKVCGVSLPPCCSG